MMCLACFAFYQAEQGKTSPVRLVNLTHSSGERLLKQRHSEKVADRFGKRTGQQSLHSQKTDQLSKRALLVLQQLDAQRARRVLLTRAKTAPKTKLRG